MVSVTKDYFASYYNSQAITYVIQYELFIFWAIVLLHECIRGGKDCYLLLQVLFRHRAVHKQLFKLKFRFLQFCSLPKPEIVNKPD